MSNQAPNAAARLFSTLTMYNGSAADYIGEAWAEALNTPQDDLPLAFADLHRLFDEVLRYIDESDVEFYGPMTDHVNHLRATAFNASNSLRSAHTEGTLMPEAPLQMLGMLAASMTGDPWDAGVNYDDLANLTTDVEALIQSVTEADLPPHVRHGLLDRLLDMLRALTHMTAGGPDAVRRAAESLAFGATVLGPATPEAARPLIALAKKVAHAAWTGVTIVSTLSGGAVALDKIIDLPVIDSGPTPPAQLPTKSGE